MARLLSFCPGAKCRRDRAESCRGPPASEAKRTIALRKEIASSECGAKNARDLFSRTTPMIQYASLLSAKGTASPAPQKLLMLRSYTATRDEFRATIGWDIKIRAN